MALTLANKSNIRRHLRYPVAGLPTTGPAGSTFGAGNIGYRYFQAWGQLEYRLNNLAPDEEARIVGQAYSAIALTGPQPGAGDTIGITFSGGPLTNPVTIDATMPAGYPASNDGRLLLTAALASACAQNGVLQAAGIIAVQPYGAGPWAMNAAPIAEVAFICSQAFTITTTGSGVTYPQITANGVLLEPTTSLDGVTNVSGYIPILNGLEGAYASSSQNLDTAAADVWKHDSTELAQRMSLYATWQGMLSDFLGIPVCQFTTTNPARTGRIRYM